MKETIDRALVENVDGTELGRVQRHDASVIEVVGRDGRVWRFPPSALARVGDRADRLRVVHALASEEVRIPLAAESVHVDRRTVEGEHVKVTVRTHTEEQVVPTVQLAHEELEVDRVRRDQEIAAMPAVHEEGDVVVIPVVEEVLVVRKALVLREEIRVRRRRVVEQRPAEKVAVRVERAEIERPSHA